MEGCRHHRPGRGHCGAGWSGFGHLKFVIPDEHQVVTGMGRTLDMSGLPLPERRRKVKKVGMELRRGW